MHGLRVNRTISELEKLYDYHAWHTDDPFRVLIFTILSQRTKDENTARASDALFAKYGNAKAISKAPLSEIRRLIRPSGFYKIKSGYVKNAANEVVRSGMPKTLEGLLKIKGVGRKTANCVLVYGFRTPAIPVDTHVHRIANRLGWVRTKTPEQTEEALEKLLPKKYWIEINQLLVQHGQSICLPRSPKCKNCPLKWCPSRKLC